eukprot:gene20906-25073_t
MSLAALRTEPDSAGSTSRERRQLLPDCAEERGSDGTGPTQKISIVEAWSFGAATGVAASMFEATSPPMAAYYTIHESLSPRTAAITQLVVSALVVLASTFFGWISDRTQSSMGRRRPYMILFPTLLIIPMVCYYSPSLVGGDNIVVNYVLSYGLVMIFYQGWLGICMAWACEIANDETSRPQLYTAMTVMGILGSIFGLFLYAGVDQSPAVTTVLGIIIALLFFFSNLYLVWTVHEERTVGLSSPREGIIATLHAAVSNPQFRVILSLRVVAAVSATTFTLLPYYFRYVSGFANPETWYSYFGVSVLTGALISAPFTDRLCARYSKLQVSAYALLSLVACFALVFPSSFCEGYTGGVLMVLIGFPFGGFGGVLSVTMNIHQADAIDYDELITGRRREAMFSAISQVVKNFVQQAVTAIFLGVLAALGFDPELDPSSETDMDGDVQPPAVIAGLQSFSLVVATSFFAGYLILPNFKISEKIHTQIVTARALVASGESACDPITQMTISNLTPKSEEEKQWVNLLETFTRDETPPTQCPLPAVAAVAEVALVVSLKVLKDLQQTSLPVVDRDTNAKQSSKIVLATP